MAKEPKKSILTNPNSQPNKKSSRSSRISAPVSFVDENEDTFIEEADQEVANGKYEEEDIASDMSKFIQEIQKRQAKKNSIVNTAFENQKKAIYAAGRSRAQEISRDGIAYLENLKASLLAVKKDDVSYEQYVSGIIPMWNEQDESVKNLVTSCDGPIENLFPKRAEAIALAEEQLNSNPAQREQSLKASLATAHDELERSRKNEMIATDAANYVKHFKALLLDS